MAQTRALSGCQSDGANTGARWESAEGCQSASDGANTGARWESAEIRLFVFIIIAGLVRGCEVRFAQALLSWGRRSSAMKKNRFLRPTLGDGSAAGASASRVSHIQQ